MNFLGKACGASSLLERRATAPADAIHKAQADIRWADHLVILYPLWLGDVPALLKGFLEQILRPGFAIDEGSTGMSAKLLTGRSARSEEHTSELQSLMRISYAVFCLKKKKKKHTMSPAHTHTNTTKQ